MYSLVIPRIHHSQAFKLENHHVGTFGQFSYHEWTWFFTGNNINISGLWDSGNESGVLAQFCNLQVAKHVSEMIYLKEMYNKLQKLVAYSFSNSHGSHLFLVRYLY